MVVRLGPDRSRRFVPASARDILRVLGAEGGSLRLIGDDSEYVADNPVPAGLYELVRGETRIFSVHVVIRMFGVQT